MDPNERLETILAACGDRGDHDHEDAIAALRDLADWLEGGGYMPQVEVDHSVAHALRTIRERTDRMPQDFMFHGIGWHKVKAIHDLASDALAKAGVA